MHNHLVEPGVEGQEVTSQLQFTNHSGEGCLELPQRSSTWPSTELLNSPRGTADLHGVYGC